MSKERPILFSGPMVRAILEGRKTQTRRVVKREVDVIDGVPHVLRYSGTVQRNVGRIDSSELVPLLCPYGSVGDRLWVRETWAPVSTFDPSPETGAIYKADHPSRKVIPIKWTPSIHMPRWASRITLEITDVIVERLNEISESDAIAEGIERGTTEPERFKHYTSGLFTPLPRHSFQSLWESINGAGSWDANPWVWVVSFKRVSE